MTEESKENGLNKYEFKGVGLKGKEFKDAENRFNQYKENNHFESWSDLELLEEKVYRETIQERYRKKIAELTENKKKKNKKEGNDLDEIDIVPSHILEAMNGNFEQIISISEKLGLLKTKKEEELFDYITSLKKKFKIWKENNWDARMTTCPFCSKVFFLNIRTEHFNVNKSPFFEDRVIANKPLFILYKQGKITKQDLANVLNVSADYVNKLEQMFNNDSSLNNKTDTNAH